MGTVQRKSISGLVKLMLGIFAVILFGSADARQAQAQISLIPEPEVTRTRERDTNRSQQAIENPCTGETVLLDTRIRTEFESRQQGDRFRSRFRTHEQGQGFAPSGARYQYQAMSDNRFESDVNTFESRFDSRQRINRSDNPPPHIKKDDFFVRTRVRTKVVQGEMTEQTVEDQRSEAQCK